MCGRYTLITSPAGLLAAPSAELRFHPNWNVAPNQMIWAILAPNREAYQPELQRFRWGMVPRWSKDGTTGKYPTINARMETVTEKPTYREPARTQRCLIVASGYYEWQKRGSRKQPFYMHPKGTDLMTFAGLYEVWNAGSDDDLRTATIVTTAPPDYLATIHDRCPLILPEDLRRAWLDPHLTDPEEVNALMRAVPQPDLALHPVGSAVGKVANNDPSLIEAVPAE